MKRSNRLVLLLGVLLAGVAFVGVLAIGSVRPNEAPPETIQVVVAKAELTLGTRLTAEMLATQQRPPAQATESYGSPAELVGTVLRRSVGAGHVLRRSDFDGGASVSLDIGGSLGSGLRGMAVAVDKADGVGYLLQAGDYVDVILSLKDERSCETAADGSMSCSSNGLNPVVVPNPRAGQVGSEGSGGHPFAAIDQYTNSTTIKVLVQNVQVLGVLPPSQPAGESTNLIITDDPDKLVAILGVTPQQVELVRFAQQAGGLSLVMRSPQDSQAGEVPTTGVTLRELVDSFGVLPPRPVQP